MGSSCAQVIDLTGSDCAEAPAEDQPQSVSSKPECASRPSPKFAGASRSLDISKATNTKEDPIVISDEDDSNNDRSKRRKRRQSVDIDAVAGSHVRSERAEAGERKRRKRHHSKYDSSEPSHHRDASVRDDKRSISSRNGESRRSGEENHKGSRRQRREEDRASRRHAEGEQERRTRNDHAAPGSPDIFVLDYGLPRTSQTITEPSTSKATLDTAPESGSLILPSHVSISDGSSNELLIHDQSLLANDDDDNDFISYLDYDDDVQRGATRYFDEAGNEMQATFACKHCGAEGDHKTIDCPVMICLTCGARNDHSTRGCPISRTCYNCGIKGHVSKDCPNRNSSYRVMRTDRLYDCQRCGSDLHTAKECPTLWRMYEYVSDARRDEILEIRRAKEGLRFGEGGEGFIGEDLWCYNCGDEGHLGDDCNSAPRPPEFPREPSAFCRFNILSGPFADVTGPSSSRPRVQREWEVEGYFDDGYGFSGPSNVGKRGRDKEKERMRQRAYEADPDEDDWFGRRGNSRKNGSQSGSHPPPLGPKRSSKDPPRTPRGSLPQKPTFSVKMPGSPRSSSGKKPNIRDRLDDGQGKGKGSTPPKHDGGRKGHSSYKKGKRDRDREHDRAKDSRESRSGGGDRTGPRHGFESYNGTHSHNSSSSRKYFGGYRS